MKKKINITVIEVFDENHNCWEWYGISRTGEVHIDKERKEVMASFMGDTYLSLDLDDRNFIDRHWRKQTKVTNLTV